MISDGALYIQNLVPFDDIKTQQITNTQSPLLLGINPKLKTLVQSHLKHSIFTPALILFF